MAPTNLPVNLDPDTVRALHTVLLNLVDHLESVYFAQLHVHETDATTPPRPCHGKPPPGLPATGR